MLKMEIIKFEAQDVISTSAPVPAKDCYYTPVCEGEWNYEDGYFYSTHNHNEACSDCELIKNTPYNPPC